MVTSSGTATRLPDYYTFTVWPVRGGVPGPGTDPAFPANLPRTGQLVSRAAGDDGALQYGVAWPVLHFTAAKDAGGQPCGVADHLTGLNWIADAAPGVVNFAAAQAAAGGTYCGFADWRIPNRAELVSLLDYATGSSVGPLTTAGLVNAGSPVGSQLIWSSTFDTWTDGDGFFGTDLTTNEVVGLYPTGQAYTWLVRGGLPPTPVTVASVAVTAPSTILATIGAGPATMACTALVTYSDNTIRDVSTLATWNSTNPPVMTVDSTGLLTGALQSGSSTITAAVGSVVSPGLDISYTAP
jgi:hypothetical protein